jgi:methionyl-tRNA formyltransferase
MTHARKLVFAGTPPFAAAALSALHHAGHQIALVLTQPDRPAGRGMKHQPSAVSMEAARLALPVSQPASLKEAAIQQRIRDVDPDAMIVAAYGLILPQAVLDIPRLGCLNIHGSLLPRWRGAAPVQRAIQAGDRETGITIMQMDAGLDTGPVLLEKRIAIAPDDTSASLFQKLTTLGSSTIVEAMQNLATLVPQAQSEQGATYARKIEKTEARIDWTMPAEVLERRIRAFDPFPGCETTLAGATLKIWEAGVLEASDQVEPGTIIDSTLQNLVVKCGQGALALHWVQRPGGRRMAIAEFLRGTHINAGERLK